MPAKHSRAASLSRRMRRSMRGRLTPAAVRTLPIDAVSGSIERLRVNGGKPTAVRLGRILVKQMPASGKAHRYLVRALLDKPIDAAELEEARATAEVMITLWEDRGVANLYADVLIAQEEHGAHGPSIAESLAAFASRFPERRLAAIQRVLNYLVAASRHDEAIAIADSLRQTIDHAGYATVAHRFALATGSFDLAIEIERSISNDPSHAPLVAELEADRALALNQADEALRVLTALKPQRSSRYSARFVEALLSRGRAADVLAYLDTTDHGLRMADEASCRFDAQWLLGNLDDAGAQLETIPEDDLISLKVLHRRRDLANAVEGDARSLIDWVHRLENGAVLRSDDIEFLTSCYFELGATGDVIRLYAQPGLRWQFSDIARYNVARARYVERDFVTARALFDGLGGSKRHWEAQKFTSRMLLESNDIDGALELRQLTRRPGEPLDEVTYHGLLHRGEFETAFEMYLPELDRERLEGSFGDHAVFEPPRGDDCEVFVIMQNGPGDEIQLASTYHALLDRVSSMTATCDPRLESLLSRSFPEIRFVPTTRMSSRRHLGFSGPDQPTRDDGPMFDLLTRDARKLADEATHVLLSRVLSGLAIEAPPVARYLAPEQHRVEVFEQRLGTRPSVGLVWRSEFNDAMRSIHYVDLRDLADVCSVNATMVCLQHDVTEDERQTLCELASDRVIFLDDVDLRDDFESMAAVVAACDAVVGVGTTTFELAAAVGTTGIMLQPNNFGSWRRQGETDQDFWHDAVKVATGPYPDALPAMMATARQFLLEALGLEDSSG